MIASFARPGSSAAAAAATERARDVRVMVISRPGRRSHRVGGRRAAGPTVLRFSGTSGRVALIVGSVNPHASCETAGGKIWWRGDG